MTKEIKLLLQILFLLWPIGSDAQLEEYAQERFYEHLLVNFEDINDLQLEAAGIILGSDTLQLKIDYVDNKIANGGWYGQGYIEVLRNGEKVEGFRARALGRALGKNAAFEEFFENWLHELGACLGQYLLTPFQAYDWENYRVYVNQYGTTLSSPLGLIDGSEKMHLDILDQVKNELEYIEEDSIFNIQVNVMNKTLEKELPTLKGASSFSIWSYLNGGKNEDLTEQWKDHFWPRKGNYLFTRTYLLVKRERE